MSRRLKALRGSVTPQQRCLIWVARPATWYPVTVAAFVCDSCQPFSHVEGSHHTAGRLGMGPDVSKNANHVPPCDLRKSPGALWVVGAGVAGMGPAVVLRLMALSTDGCPSSSWVCAWFRVRRPLSNSVHYNHKRTLKWERACTGSNRAFSVSDQLCNVEAYW